MGGLDCVQYDEHKLPFIDLGTAVLRINREEPPKWALEMAKNELREIPEIVEPAIEEFRRLLKDEKSLHVPLEDEYVLMFLRPCKYYPESAIKRLKNFFLMKVQYGEWCENIMPEMLKHVFEAEVLSFLPERDQHGRRILLLEAGKKWKPSKVPVIDLFRTLQLCVLGAMLEPISQICGGVVIIDVEGLPMSHILHFRPSFASMFLHYVQNCICIRLKAVHIINNSAIFNMLFAIFKPFIQEKLRNRIFFHGKDYKTSLAAHIDRNVLPAKFGGTTTWELPSGPLVCEFMNYYTPDGERFKSYGYSKDYKITNK